MSANPGIENGVSWFKAWAVGSSGLSISFYPIIFFRYSSVMKDCCILPKEVLEVKRASDDLSAFVKAKDKMDVWVLWVFVLFPTVVLKVS